MLSYFRIDVFIFAQFRYFCKSRARARSFAARDLFARAHTSGKIMKKEEKVYTRDLFDVFYERRFFNSILYILMSNSGLILG